MQKSKGNKKLLIASYLAEKRGVCHACCSVLYRKSEAKTETLKSQRLEAREEKLESRD
jgi:hypothetical protein